MPSKKKKSTKLVQKNAFSNRLFSIFVASFALIGIIWAAASFAAPVSAGDISYATGIKGYTYMRQCDSNGACKDVPASLIIYVYQSPYTNPSFNFFSQNSGYFSQTLKSGNYVLKGSPNCGHAQCLMPLGNVPVSVTKSFVNLKLVYVPGTGLTGGVQQ